MVGCHSFQVALLLVIFFIIIFLFVTFHWFEHHQQNSGLQETMKDLIALQV